MNKNRQTILFVILLAGMFFVVSGNAKAASDSFDVTQDTFINEAYPDNNYGSVGSIVVSSEPIDRFGFLQFEEVSLPEDAVLDDANLEFYVYDNSYNADGWVRIGLIGGNEWEEDEPIWNGPYPGPIMSAGNFVEVNINFSTGWKEVDVTDLVGKWLSGDKDQRGLYIYPNGGNIGFSLRSKEHGSNQAAIEVEYHIEEEEEFDFNLVSPEDEGVFATARPTFEWEEIDEDSDVDDYLLVVNMVIDDGDDVEEVVSEKISDNETEFVLEGDLEEGEYRWYMEALRDDESSIHRTASWEFTVEFPTEEDEVSNDELEDETNFFNSRDDVSALSETSENSEDEKQGDTVDEENKEKSDSLLDNFLYLLLGIGLAVAGYLTYKEIEARKKKKENYKGLVEKKKEKTKEPKE